MSGNHLKLLTALSVLTLVVCTVSGISAFSEDSDAVTDLGGYIGGTNQSSSTKVYSVVTGEISDCYNKGTFYVSVGARIGLSDPPGYSGWVEEPPQGWGLYLQPGDVASIDGTVSKAGTFTLTYVYDLNDTSKKRSVKFTAVESSDANPVESIKLTWTLGSSNIVTMNSTVSIRAIVSPQTASDLTVSWSITENTGSATITREWNDTYNGEYRNGCDIRGDSPGTVTLTATANDGSGASKSVTITIRPYTYFLDYDPNGGLSPDGDEYSWYDQLTTTDSSKKVTFTITDFEPTREGYKFKGWSKSSSASTATYKAGDRISVGYGDEVILYAVWGQSNLTFNSIQSDTNVIVGSSFAYSPTMNVSGCSFSVTGASWLSVSGGTIYGTPTTPGTYNVKVTASCSGYTSVTQSFTITVYSSLEFTTSPTSGLIVFER